MVTQSNEEKINVLLVDDRPENLVALEALLCSDQLNLIKCESGEAALKYLMKDECALILLDVQMPGIDGYETAKLIKARERSKNTPIIFVTAINKDPEHVYTGYSVGAVDYIFKPYDPDILKSKVESFVEMYMNGKKLQEQTRLLNMKTKELEKANEQLIQMASELRRAEAMAKVIGETSMDTMITFDEKGQIMTVNPAVKKMFGWTQEELHDTPVERLFRYSLVNLYHDHKQKGNGAKMGLLETEAVTRTGKVFPAEVQIHEAHVEQSPLYACTVRDITERKAQVDKLRYMAMHDMLTGLPNRTQLYQIISSMRGVSFALILFDLDHFKSINDTLGHSYGDALLKKLGGELLHSLEEGDIIARLGGDEFAVLLPKRDVTSAVNVARTMLNIMEQPVVINDISLAIGASMGIVFCPEHGEDADTLLRRADVAMYTAKRTGSGYALYDRNYDRNDPYYLSLMSQMRGAIEKGQFKLFYQPKMKMKTREIMGVEALIRWEHPEYGLIAPSDFIPMAEQIGFIHPLTCWVLEEAIRQCKRWELIGLDIQMAVNISVRSLQDTEFPIFLADLMKTNKLSTDKLQLEITESFLMADTMRALDILEQIKQMGIKMAVDDFGTGFSSLSYLKQLPVSHVKIDKSFIEHITQDMENSMIVRSIINLAHNLRMGVVAEGVEDADTWRTLEAWGCDEAQGYYLARPMAAKEIEGWLFSAGEGM